MRANERVRVHAHFMKGWKKKMKKKRRRRACLIIYTGRFIEMPHREAQNHLIYTHTHTHKAIVFHLLYSFKFSLCLCHSRCFLCACVSFIFLFFCVFLFFIVIIIVIDTADVRRKQDMISFLFIAHYNIYIKTLSSYLDVSGDDVWLLNTKRLRSYKTVSNSGKCVKVTRNHIDWELKEMNV